VKPAVPSAFLHHLAWSLEAMYYVILSLLLVGAIVALVVMKKKGSA
jgi:VIT1/CCC1 family predicted Fe2+/Mn2+ transporter